MFNRIPIPFQPQKKKKKSNQPKKEDFFTKKLTLFNDVSLLINMQA